MVKNTVDYVLYTQKYVIHFKINNNKQYLKTDLVIENLVIENIKNGLDKRDTARILHTFKRALYASILYQNIT